jgi:pescadillo protein
MAHRKQEWAKRVKKERFRKRYLTRMQATRLLQTDSMGFRRLCILKGIYPRAIGRSKQKASGNDKQYYLSKEIKWLVHDQIASKVHAFEAYEKKSRAAKAQHRFTDLKALQERKPAYKLDQTIKERYPFFVDAVKDIDDAMTMVSLYAFLSPEIKSDSTIEFHHALPTGLHEKAKAVVDDFTTYVSKAHLLSRAFISIKGYYYEVFVHGQRVIFLMPHEYASKFPEGVQQYVLITFLEFYVELLRFVMHKLNRDWQKDEEQRDRDQEDNAEANVADFDQSNMAAFVLQEAKKKAKERNATELQRQQLAANAALMTKFVVCCSREVPSKHIRFVVEACGGRVVNEFNSDVTHFCVDRPQLLPGVQRLAHVEYVQPQYFFDCLNARLVLPVNGYRMGEELPPHVSPFTVSLTNQPADNVAVEEIKKAHPRAINEYVPQRVHELRRLHDSSYVAADPKQKLEDLADDDSELSETEHVGALQDEDEIALSDDEVRDARKQTAWVDEQVKERPERTKLSEVKVRKQREMGLLNAPTSEGVAAQRQELVKKLQDRRRGESREVRATRKLKQMAVEDRATDRMKLQVARKKAARYYKMVSATVNAGKRHEKVLESKAKALEKGVAKVADGGKTFASAKRARLEKKVGKAKADEITSKKANPYKKLPAWVQ